MPSEPNEHVALLTVIAGNQTLAGFVYSTRVIRTVSAVDYNETASWDYLNYKKFTNLLPIKQFC